MNKDEIAFIVLVGAPMVAVLYTLVFVACRYMIKKFN